MLPLYDLVKKNIVYLQTNYLNSYVTGEWKCFSCISVFGNNDVFTDSCANKQNGIYSDRENCRGFIECSEGVSFKGACGPGLAFNPSHQTCDYTYNVPGCQ